MELGLRRRGRAWRNRSDARRFRSPVAWATLALIAVLAVVLERYSAVELRGAPRVVDGDSLEFGTDRVRLAGIDAPELSQICEKDGAGIACGRMARAHLRVLVGDNTVCIGIGIDRYDRILARCRAGGSDVNAAMVRDGWAVNTGEFAAEERSARQSGKGLWAMRFDVPADWREAHPRSSEAEAGWSLTASVRALLMAVRNRFGW